MVRSFLPGPEDVGYWLLLHIVPEDTPKPLSSVEAIACRTDPEFGSRARPSLVRLLLPLRRLLMLLLHSLLLLRL